MNMKIFNGNNLPHELLLTTRQKTDSRNAYKNNMSTDKKFSKAQISKVIQSGEFLGSLLRELADPLIKVDVPFGKKFFCSFRNYSCSFSNWCRNSKENTWFKNNNSKIFNIEIKDIVQIVQALEDSNILLKGVTKIIKNKNKRTKRRFLSMLLGTLGASLLGNMLARKWIVRDIYGNKKRKWIVTAGYGFPTLSFNKLWN